MILLRLMKAPLITITMPLFFFKGKRQRYHEHMHKQLLLFQIHFTFNKSLAQTLTFIENPSPFCAASKK